MSWVSLICLLALSSGAFARSMFNSGYGSVPPPPPPPPMDSYGSSSRFISPKLTYGGYSTPAFTPPPPPPPPPTFSYGYTTPTFTPPPPPPPTTSSYGYSTPTFTPPPPPPPPTTFSYGYNTEQMVAPSLPFRTLNIQNDVIVPLPLTQADILCKGQVAETVIPIEGNRKFIVCLDDGKGVEQSCPKGLYFHTESRRCERRLGVLENACLSGPCLNGGQCIPDGAMFQCSCPSGFDGRVCELDARVCQTQQPCGQDSDTKCQSFRFGAALSYVCLFRSGTAYGQTIGQMSGSPCTGTDGPFPLAFTNKGFIMCDGDRMFIESCPGGTIWDSASLACSWPDMETMVGPLPSLDRPIDSYGQSYATELPRPIITVPKVLIPSTPLIQPRSGY